MLDRGLDPGVEGVEPIQRERLGQCEPPARERVGSVMCEHAVTEREPARVVETGLLGGRLDHPQPELDVAEQPALVAEPDLGPERELARAPEVVEQRRGQQQVLVQALVQGARLDGQRPDGDGVLEQAAEVGVVLPARGG